MATRSSADRTHSMRLLLFVLGSLFTANFAQWFLCRVAGLGNPGNIHRDVSNLWHLHQWTDSWLPMMKSLDYFHDFPTKPLYFAPLYDTLIYSLASLLPLVALRKLGVADPTMLHLLALGSFLAVLGIAVCALVMGRRLLAKRGESLRWPAIVAVCLAVLFCYPLLKGFSLGNAQTFLSFGFALLLVFWTNGNERASGITACILTCVKPQYVLILIWMLMRKRWNAAIAFLVSGAVLFALAVAVFGLHNNLDYLKVLASLSHKAQSHYGNQSMFGTVNRMIFNGENIGYTPYVYTPYIPWVYRLTVTTALTLLCLALFFPWGKLKGSSADLAAIGLVSVASSPMAWEHHYGIVLGIFAWLWFAYGAQQDKRPWLTGLAAFLMLNSLSATNMLWHYRGWNLLQSYMYLGALLLLGILMALARRATRNQLNPLP
ncbi:MAG: glycosyltransferase family 87 protein [Acidobacteriaceae bacterium]|nr:glycosyltransferase family 87 protein [Acidobacteriaceae bacterium]